MDIKGQAIFLNFNLRENFFFYLENDAKLFTPGPLTTSLTVKQSMLHDLGSRDTVFVNIVAYIRGKLIELAG